MPDTLAMPPSGYRIALASADDLRGLAAVERAAARLFPDTLLPNYLREHTLPAAELAQARREQRLWVAKRYGHSGADDAVAGFACAQLEHDHALLRELSVHPAHHRRGLGRALLGAAVAWARDAGMPALYLTTFEAFTPSAALYRGAGFRALRAEETPAFLAATLDSEAEAGLHGRIAMRLALTQTQASIAP